MNPLKVHSNSYDEGTPFPATRRRLFMALTVFRQTFSSADAFSTLVFVSFSLEHDTINSFLLLQASNISFTPRARYSHVNPTSAERSVAYL
jgi:hypothetical protein